jgi:hypothetical protein
VHVAVFEGVAGRRFHALPGAATITASQHGAAVPGGPHDFAVYRVHRLQERGHAGRPLGDARHALGTGGNGNRRRDDGGDCDG